MVPHVVLVPLPAQGHINPLTSLAQFLAASGISVTLVHSTRTHSLLSTSSTAAAAMPTDANSLRMPIRIEIMPDDSKPAERLSLETILAAIPAMSNGLDAILQKLMQEANPPCCLIHDVLLPWCHDVAVKCGLPRVMVWTGSASVFSLVLHIPELLARDCIPAVDKESRAKIVDFVPGMPPLRVADLPEIVRAEKGLHAASFEFITSSYTHLKSAERVLVNSMFELEGQVVNTLRIKAGVRFDPVGPLFLMSSSSSLTSQSTAHSSLLQEDTSCLTWLDQQEASSVIYISLGSIAAVEGDVLVEMAHGLEASGERFLWVVRPDAHKDRIDTTAEELLPEGFIERTRGRGIVISWAPQLAVLAHPSVGGFLTHCGWNSVMESLSYGIPMLGFPQRAEQNTNLKFIVDEWKVGMALLEEGEGKVDRARVQTTVCEILNGSGEGAEVRRRALEWRDIAHGAAELHGTSRCNLEKLIDDLRDGHFAKAH